jgi:phosphoribulokinase
MNPENNKIYQGILKYFLTDAKIARQEQYAAGTDYVLAVSGPAASGKTTFCRGLKRHLTDMKISAVHVPLDGYLLDRLTRSKNKFSGYDPQSSDLPRMIDQMKTLIFNGKPIDLPLYDHETGEHKRPCRIEPARVIILDGIMSLQYEMRERFSNLNIFFTSDDIVIRGLRLLTDMEERGYSVFQALAHSDQEFLSYNKWIYPQITFAHVKIWVDKQRQLHIRQSI